MFFLGEISILALKYKLGYIDWETFKKKAKKCAAGSAGRIIGGTIGFFLGSLIGFPMLGDFIGSFLGEIIGNTIASLLLDDERDRREYTLADFERERV